MTNLPTLPDTYPVKPGDWVANPAGEIARVKDIGFDGSYVVDLYLYDRDGTKLGRTSPAMGGPRTFEPCCDYSWWHRIEEPVFPLSIGRVERDGKVLIDWVMPSALPNREWRRPVRRPGRATVHDHDLVVALRSIAAGHNDARAVAWTVLARKGLRVE